VTSQSRRLCSYSHSIPPRPPARAAAAAAVSTPSLAPRAGPAPLTSTIDKAHTSYASQHASTHTCVHAHASNHMRLLTRAICHADKSNAMAANTSKGHTPPLDYPHAQSFMRTKATPWLSILSRGTHAPLDYPHAISHADKSNAMAARHVNPETSPVVRILPAPWGLPGGNWWLPRGLPGGNWWLPLSDRAVGGPEPPSVTSAGVQETASLICDHGTAGRCHTGQWACGQNGAGRACRTRRCSNTPRTTTGGAGQATGGGGRWRGCV
jgi:hypothetical protein